MEDARARAAARSLAYRLSRSLSVARSRSVVSRRRVGSAQKGRPRFALSLQRPAAVGVSACACCGSLDRAGERQSGGLRRNVGMPGLFSAWFRARAALRDGGKGGLGGRRARPQAAGVSPASRGLARSWRLLCAKNATRRERQSDSLGLDSGETAVSGIERGGLGGIASPAPGADAR